MPVAALYFGGTYGDAVIQVEHVSPFQSLHSDVLFRLGENAYVDGPYSHRLRS